MYLAKRFRMRAAGQSGEGKAFLSHGAMLKKQKFFDSFFQKRTAVFLHLIAALACVTQVMAQTPPPASATSSATLEEVVVTAQRRQENLQKVGITVTAVSGAALRNLNVQKTTDVVHLTPGVFISANGGGENAQYSIRGVTQNDFADFAESPIAVYVDDAYIPNLQGQNFGLFDMSRVEILKGPQGTLFGRNATGGLVNYVINKPTDTFQAYSDVTYASFNQVRVDSAVSGPITDTLSGRASFYWDSHDPIWKNVLNPADSNLKPCCQNLGGEQDAAGRAQLQYKPNADLTIRLLGDVSNQDTSTAPYTVVSTVPIVNAKGVPIGGIFAAPTETRTAIGPGGVNYTGIGGSPPSRAPGADWFGFIAPNPQSLELSEDFANSNLDYSDSRDVGLHVDYDLGGVKLVSITSYRHFAKFGALDADASPVNFLDEGSVGTAQNFSEELRLEHSSPVLNWTAGLYYLRIDQHYDTALLAPPESIFAGILGAPVTGFDLTDDEKLSTSSTSLFVQDEYTVLPGLQVITGLRGIDENQVYDYTSTGNVGTGDYTIAYGNPVYNALAPFNDRRTELLWAGKAEVQYQANNDLLLFASFNRGAKAGNFNAPLPTGTVLTPAQMSYKAETLLAYEAGVKSTLLDDRAYLDASVFDYDYHNYQAFSFSGVSGYTQNHPARSYGGEVSLTLKPVDGLQIDSALSLFHARVKDIAIGAGIAPSTVQPTFAPSEQFNTRVAYTLPLKIAGGTLQVGGNAYYTSSFFTDIQNFADQRLPGYWLFDAQVAWHAPGGHWVAAAFANNLLDKRYGTILFDLTTLCGCEEKAFGQPRFIGGKLAYTY